MTDKRATILLVDDTPANLIALDAMLGTDERILMTAHSGKEALEILDAEKIDLILLDVQMPDMNGFELAQMVKSNGATADIPIIFASAERLDHASRMKGFEEGAIDYLVKPLDPELTRAKVSVLLEVQRQKRLLIEKNAALERSALLINNSADIIGVVDARSLVIDEMNPAFTTLLGYFPEEVQGRDLTSFMDGVQSENLKKLARNGDKTISFETAIRRKDRTLKWFEWKVVVKDGKWFVNARDITEIKALNTTLKRNILQLEAANKELESFSYSVSHDLRAPLRAVHGNAQALEEDFAEALDDEAKRFLKKIRDNAMRMDGLINDLLSFSRVGQKEVRKSMLEMDELVRDIFAEVTQAQPNQAVVTIGSLPVVYGDLSMMRIVWTNLISNAIKYSSKKPNPTIEIGGRDTGESVEYFIRDNGAGFNMTYAKKLFGTFQRFHDATEFEGVGIGLAIVQRIILKHGGAIRAEAKVDEGACFWFTLPAWTSSAESDSAGR